jgi:hypothetical protein
VPNDPAVSADAAAEQPPRSGTSADASAAPPPLPDGRVPDAPAGRDDTSSPPASPDARGPDSPKAPPVDLCATKSCVFENATSTCEPSTGLCTPPVCSQGFGDCDPSAGCESRLDSSAHCGSCTNACDVGFTCQAGTCSCPQTTCGGACVDTATSDKHCGRCDHPCPAACEGGVCRCPTRSAANLIKGGGFDRDVNGWQTSVVPTDYNLTWSRDDAADCSGSGSMIVDNLRAGASQSTILCIPANGGTDYNYGAWMKGVNDDVTGFVSIDWFGTANCSGDIIDTAEFQHSEPHSVVWMNAGGTARSPAGARAGQMQLGVSDKGRLFFDMAYLTPPPGRF